MLVQTENCLQFQKWSSYTVKGPFSKCPVQRRRQMAGQGFISTASYKCHHVLLQTLWFGHLPPHSFCWHRIKLQRSEHHGDTVSFPGHMISFPGHMVSFPGHMISFPGHMVSFPGHMASFPGHMGMRPNGT